MPRAADCPPIHSRKLPVRILFLDFDGVLHSSRAELDGKYFRWLPALVKLLANFPDVKIVVHSTWRYDHTDSELRELLGELGERFVGSAPRGPREQVIQMVLQANKGKFTDYLVLDDAPHEFPEGKLNTLFINGIQGLGSVSQQLGLLTWLLKTAPPKEA